MLMIQGLSGDILVEDSPFIIGRATTSDLQLLASGVSRRHCVLYENEGDWWVEDLRSKNGTRLNGEKIDPGNPIKLDIGDVISIDKAQFVVA